MKGNRSRDTLPELRLRSELHARGLRYRVDRRPLGDLRRRADIVFSPSKVAVFVDGCYWHGCPKHWVPSKSHVDYWRRKIERNRERDRETDEALRDAGWAVVRVWEHEDPIKAADEVEALVRARR